MRAILSVVMLLALVPLSGCIGSVDSPDPTESNDGEDAAFDGADADLDDELGAEGMLAPVETPVSLQGESPPGIWVCAASPVTGRCSVIETQETTYRFDLEFDGALTGWALTMASDPVTPENPGMRLNIRVEDGDNVTWMNAEGPSPLTWTMDELSFSPEASVQLTAYTMPDADVGGDVWVDPIPQPYTIEGIIGSVIETF